MTRDTHDPHDAVSGPPGTAGPGGASSARATGRTRAGGNFERRLAEARAQRAERMETAPDPKASAQSVPEIGASPVNRAKPDAAPGGAPGPALPAPTSRVAHAGPSRRGPRAGDTLRHRLTRKSGVVAIALCCVAALSVGVGLNLTSHDGVPDVTRGATGPAPLGIGAGGPRAAQIGAVPRLRSEISAHASLQSAEALPSVASGATDARPVTDFAAGRPVARDPASGFAPSPTLPRIAATTPIPRFGERDVPVADPARTTELADALAVGQRVGPVRPAGSVGDASRPAIGSAVAPPRTAEVDQPSAPFAIGSEPTAVSTERGAVTLSERPAEIGMMAAMEGFDVPSPGTRPVAADVPLMEMGGVVPADPFGGAAAAFAIAPDRVLSRAGSPAAETSPEPDAGSVRPAGTGYPAIDGFGAPSASGDGPVVALASSGGGDPAPVETRRDDLRQAALATGLSFRLPDIGPAPVVGSGLPRLPARADDAKSPNGPAGETFAGGGMGAAPAPLRAGTAGAAPVADPVPASRPQPKTQTRGDFAVADMRPVQRPEAVVRPGGREDGPAAAVRSDLVARADVQPDLPVPASTAPVTVRGRVAAPAPLEQDGGSGRPLRISAVGPDTVTPPKPAALTGPDNPFDCFACGFPALSGPVPGLALILADGAGDASDYAADLRDYGFREIETRRAQLPVAQSQVRYFREADAEVARALAEQAGAELVDLTWFSPAPEGGLIEIMLSEARLRH